MLAQSLGVNLSFSLNIFDVCQRAIELMFHHATIPMKIFIILYYLECNIIAVRVVLELKKRVLLSYISVC